MDLLELRKIEQKWQKKWENSGLFNADPKKDREKFFITVPYPYANAPLHVGHGRSYTIGDIIARYKRMRGYHVLFPMAFHISGTPISSISDQIQRGSKEKIELYKSYVKRYVNDPKKVDKIIDSFEKPFNVAEFFASKIINDFKKLGFSIDWRRRFHTGMKIYNQFVNWQFKRLKDVDALKRGKYHVRYCLLHDQAAGEDDIEDGDVDPVEINEFVGIKFDFKEGVILASTLRPETLFGATNLWVNPQATYVKIRWKEQILYISKKALVKFKHQHKSVTKLEEIQGEEFIGKTATSPLGDQLLILPAPFVDPNNASGFVYSEPSDAPYDYMGLKNLKEHLEKMEQYGLDPKKVKNIEPIKIIQYPGIEGHHTEKIIDNMGIQNLNDEKLEEATKELYEKQFYNGKMKEKAGKFAGFPVQKAREKVREDLLSKDEAIIFYETSRKAVCRAGGKIIIARVEDQWFLDYSLKWWKDKVRKWLDKMTILPKKYKKAFYDTVDWLRERPCARKRGLGTKLPFDKEWTIESLSDSTIYMAFYTIVHIIKKNEIKASQLTPSFFDYIFLRKNEIDEVAEETNVPQPLLEKMREEFLYWYPVDLRHTAIAHLSNHLIFFIFHHLAIFNKSKAPKSISLNEMLIREGRKMSKSKGNVILLTDITEDYSADLFRLVISSVADLSSTLNWTEEKVKSCKRKLLRFVELAFQSINVGNIKEIGEELPEKWFLSKFYSKLMKGKELLEKEKIREYTVELFFKNLADLRYYRERVGKEGMLNMLKKILPDWIRALSPIIPHIAEEIWTRLGRKGFISVAEWPKEKEELIDKRAEWLEEKIKNALSDTREIMQILKEETEKAIYIIASNWKRNLLHTIDQLYKEEKDERLDVGKIMKKLMQEPDFRSKGEKVSNIVQNIARNPSILPKGEITQENEKKIFEDAKEFLRSETGLKIEIITEEEAKDQGYTKKANASLPLKPGIVLKEK